MSKLENMSKMSENIYTKSSVSFFVRALFLKFFPRFVFTSILMDCLVTLAVFILEDTLSAQTDNASMAVLLAVFILEDALSVQTDNASMVVFILRTHYPAGRTWANIVVRLVMRFKYNYYYIGLSPIKLARLFILKEVIKPSPDSKMLKFLTFDDLFPPLRHSC